MFTYKNSWLPDCTVTRLSNVYDLPKTRAAIAKSMVVDGSPAKILLAGDSIMTGQGAGTGTNGWTGASIKNIPSGLKKFLNGAINCIDLTFGGSNLSTIANCILHDSRLSNSVVTNPWQLLGGGLGGGDYYYSGINAGDRMNYTPTSQFNRYQIIYQHRSLSQGKFKIFLDGVLDQTMNDATSSDSIVTTPVFSVPLGNHTLGIENNYVGNTLIKGYMCWDSSKVNMFLLGAGSGGAAALYYSGFTNPIYTFGPECVVLEFSTNELLASTSANVFVGAMETMIIQHQSAGRDVILLSGFPFNNVNVTNGLLDSYIQGLKGLSNKYKVNLIDARTVLGANYTVANAAGYYYSDGIHLSELGCQQIAAKLGSIIKLGAGI